MYEWEEKKLYSITLLSPKVRLIFFMVCFHSCGSIVVYANLDMCLEINLVPRPTAYGVRNVMRSHQQATEFNKFDGWRNQKRWLDDKKWIGLEKWETTRCQIESNPNARIYIIYEICVLIRCLSYRKLEKTRTEVSSFNHFCVKKR